MPQSLSRTDVIRLLHDRSAATRADTAAKLVADYRQSEMTEDERALAEDIIRKMASDAAVMVRQVLSENLKDHPDIPHDVALTLAKDIDEVALPILEFSTALSDADLIEIVQSEGVNKQTAIARRPHVSEQVSGALVDTGVETVVATLVANHGAEISETSMQQTLDTFPDSEPITSSMAHRGALPMTVAERLVAMVSESLQEHILTHHDLGADVASDMIWEARERATASMLSNSGGDSWDTDNLIRHLQENGRLTPTLILRAVCMGDMRFFESGLARRAGIPVLNAARLIEDPGERGLRSLFAAADMPEVLFPATRVAIEVSQELEYDGEEGDRERFRRTMLERILTQYQGIEADDLDYLLGSLAKLCRSEIGRAAA